jgi:hypothetical protein
VPAPAATPSPGVGVGGGVGGTAIERTDLPVGTGIPIAGKPGKWILVSPLILARFIFPCLDSSFRIIPSTTQLGPK